MAWTFNTYDASLKDTIRDDRVFGEWVLVSETHELVVVLGIVHTGHHPLVISEEEDGQGCHAVDGDEKLALPEVVNHIETVDVLHFER